MLIKAKLAALKNALDNSSIMLEGDYELRFVESSLVPLESSILFGMGYRRGGWYVFWYLNKPYTFRWLEMREELTFEGAASKFLELIDNYQTAHG